MKYSMPLKHYCDGSQICSGLRQRWRGRALDVAGHPQPFACTVELVPIDAVRMVFVHVLCPALYLDVGKHIFRFEFLFERTQEHARDEGGWKDESSHAQSKKRLSDGALTLMVLALRPLQAGRSRRTYSLLCFNKILRNSRAACGSKA